MKLGKGKNTVPHSVRKSGKKAAHKEQKRYEAKLRQQQYNALSFIEKVALIQSRPGKSARELSKLQRTMEAPHV